MIMSYPVKPMTISINIGDEDKSEIEWEIITEAIFESISNALNFDPKLILKGSPDFLEKFESRLLAYTDSSPARPLPSIVPLVVDSIRPPKEISSDTIDDEVDFVSEAIVRNKTLQTYCKFNKILKLTDTHDLSCYVSALIKSVRKQKVKLAVIDCAASISKQYKNSEIYFHTKKASTYSLKESMDALVQIRDILKEVVELVEGCQLHTPTEDTTKQE